MRARFILLGTNHPLQFGAVAYPKEKVSAYREYLIGLCSSEAIKLIAEEASQDGLKRFSVADTIAATAAKETGCAYKMVDLSTDERTQLGIADDQLARATFALKSKGQVNLRPVRNRLDKVSDQVREGVWVARTLLESTWPVLLILGANHVRHVERLIRSLRQDVVIAHADYEP